MPSLKRAPHASVKQGQKHTSGLVIFANEPQNHQQPTHSQTLPPPARQDEPNKTLNLPEHKLSVSPWGCCLSSVKHWASKVGGLQKW